MPNIRIMNWNIERLSATKTAIAGMAANIGKIIVHANADVVVILELASGSATAAMEQVSDAARAASLASGGTANDYTGWLVSYPTSYECYGVLIRDLNVVRPIVVATGPTGAGTGDGANAALTNLNRNRFATWPGTMANAYTAALPPPAWRMRLPLLDVYGEPQRPRAAKRARFAGGPLSAAAGGYSLGRGFRLPCLIALRVMPVGGPLVPIVACHLGAVRSGANALARRQMMQYKDLHISQLYEQGEYLQVDGAAVPVRDLIITGDFNIDFLEQAPPLGRNSLRTRNRNAFSFITPTSTNGGSALPAALPPAAGPLPPVPFVAPVGGWVPRTFPSIPELDLKTAITAQGTMLRRYNGAAADPADDVHALRSASFDNFFFGGAHLSATYQNLTPPDAGSVHNVPSFIVQPHFPMPPLAIEVGGAWSYYAILRGKARRNALSAPRLRAAAPVAALTTNDRLIASRFISDHLPCIVQFNLP